MVIHPQARTTPKLRAEIKAQRDRKQVDLAKQYNVTPQTICRVPCDYIPKGSYPLFRTRQILNDWLTQNPEEA